MNSREERVRQRAAELWEQAGKPADRDEEFWYQAEAEIAAEDAEPSQPSPRRT